MTIAEVLLLDFDSEIANARRTLERVPEADPQWKPHEKSTAIGRLAVHTARLPGFCTRMLTTPETNMDQEKMPDFLFESTAHVLSELDRTATEARSHLAACS